MALGQIPPWLDVNPQLFTRAIEAGSQAGLGLARIRESAAARAAQDRQQQDMLDQRLAQAAQEADLSRELRREQLSQQLQIEGARNERLDAAQKEGLGLREAQLLLGQTRAENEAGARDRGLSLREQALQLSSDRYANAPDVRAAEREQKRTEGMAVALDKARIKANQKRAALQTLTAPGMLVNPDLVSRAKRELAEAEAAVSSYGAPGTKSGGSSSRAKYRWSPTGGLQVVPDVITNPGENTDLEGSSDLEE